MEAAAVVVVSVAVSCNVRQVEALNSGYSSFCSSIVQCVTDGSSSGYTSSVAALYSV